MRSLCSGPALLAALVVGCSGATAPAPATRPHTAPPGETETKMQLDDAKWLVGTWQNDAGDVSETWVRVDDRLVGVGFATRDDRTTWFEVMILHELDGALLLTAMPSGNTTTDFEATALSDQHLAVANPEHDDPRELRYAREGDTLHIDIDGARGARSIELHRVSPRPAAALADADRAFDADTVARAGAAWAERFEPGAAMWPRGSDRTTGSAQISAAIDGLAAAGVSLRWAPAAAEFSAAGDMGFTSGPYTVSQAGSPETARTGIYVTVWRRNDEGAWNIAFDTGVASPPPASDL